MIKLDMTKEVNLKEKDQRLYEKLRLALYFLAIVFSAYVLFLTVFPSEYFSFSFLNASSLKNTLTEMETINENIFPDKGAVSKNGGIVFYASPFSQNHSEADVTITLDKKSAPLQTGTIEARKSYKAFFYPEGSFSELSSKPTISDLRDGTIVTYGQSAYIISGEEILPIDSEVTFTALGLNWDDAVATGIDKISLYKKGKLLTMSSAHPNGFVFSVFEDNKLFFIKDGKKYPLPSLGVAKQLSNNEPILVSGKSLSIKEMCELKKDMLSFRSYSCRIPLENINNLLGKDFEFRLKTTNDIKIDDINITFKKSISSTNIKDTLSIIKKRILANYVQTP